MCQEKRIVVGVLVLSFVLIVSSTHASKPTVNRRGYLLSKGFGSDTSEQITEATKCKDNFLVRSMAFELLKERMGKGAIPALKKGLDDEQFHVRRKVARLLGQLNDKSAIKRMKQDLKEFAPNNGMAVPVDPKITDANEIESIRNKRNYRLLEACRAGFVLAEMGDASGYELAARVALEGEWPGIRGEAVKCLAYIAAIDKRTPVMEDMDAVAVLKGLAETETNNRVLRDIMGNVGVKLDHDTAIEILEIIKNAPNKLEITRREVQEVLNYLIKRRIAYDKKRIEKH